MTLSSRANQRLDRFRKSSVLPASVESGTRPASSLACQLVETDCVAGHLGLEVRRETGKE